jgi:hypothetical protein
MTSGVIGAFFLAALQAAPGQPAPALIECRFPVTVPSTPQTPKDIFAIYLPEGVRSGPAADLISIDPAGMLRGGELDRVATVSNAEITIVGPRRAPGPFFTLRLDTSASAGSNYAAIDFLDDDNHQRLGFCLTFNGADASSRFGQIRESARQAGVGK